MSLGKFDLFDVGKTLNRSCEIFCSVDKHEFIKSICSISEHGKL